MKIIVTGLKTLIFAAFGLGAVLLVSTNLQLSQYFSLLAVQSGSMHPALNAGDLVISIPSKTGEYYNRDIIVFTSTAGVKITHRIIEIIQEDGEKFYRTQGDANDASDTDLVPEKDVIGRVRVGIPLLGRFVNFSKTTSGFFLLIVIPAFYIIFSELISIRDEFTKRKPKATDISAAIILLLSCAFYFSGTTLANFSITGESGDNIFSSTTTFSTLFESLPYTCKGGAADDNTTNGTTNFIIDGSNIGLEVLLREASPSATYDVTVNQDPGDCPHGAPNFPGGITTDSNGNADETFSLTKVGGAVNYWVTVEKTGHIIRSKAVSE